MDGLRAQGWLDYLGREYKFTEGDMVPVELVGGSEKEDKVAYELLEDNGDVYLKGRSGRAPLSHRAGEIWVIPSLLSSTGQALVTRRKLVIEHEKGSPKKGDDADAGPLTYTVVVQTTITVWGNGGLTEVREYLIGTDCLVKTNRTYTTKKPPASPVFLSKSQILTGLQKHLEAKQWIRMLAGGSSGMAVPAGFVPAGLTGAANDFSVPQWLLKENVDRRITVDYVGVDGESCSAAAADAALILVHARSADESWNVVDTFSSVLGEVSLVPMAHSLTGDALRLCRSVPSMRWELLMCVDATKTVLESLSFSKSKFVGFDIDTSKPEDVISESTSWERALLDEEYSMRDSLQAAQMALPMLRSTAQAEQMKEGLALAKWVSYLERPHKFKAGDELAIELCSGASAKKCVAMGLALGMTVPIPGFCFVGGLGGAIVAVPAVMTAVARYIADDLSHRFVICEGMHGDVELCEQFNHMAQSWKQSEMHSFKAGEFTIEPYPRSLNGEQLHVIRRIDCKGKVLNVHEYIRVERLGRGIDIQTDILHGDLLMSQTNRYFEYDEGSVIERTTLTSKVPSEGEMSTQFKWIEEHTDEWLVEHEAEVIEEAKLLASKAHGNEQIMQSSTDLLSMLEGATAKSSTFAEAQSTVEHLEANSKVDLAKVLSLGQNLVAELAVQANDMDEEEKERAKVLSTTLGKELKELGNGSSRVKKALSATEQTTKSIEQRGSIAAESAEGNRVYGSQLKHLHQEGQQIIANVHTPEEAIVALRENPEFLHEVQELALDYIEDAVCSTQIPPISGNREWGTYALEGLAIKRFTIDRESIEPQVGESMIIAIEGITIEFDSFKFELDKTTFPKVQDKGLAAATSTFSADVSFDVVTDAERNITVSNVAAHISIDALPVKVIHADHKWIFNKLLSFFSERVKTEVQREVRLQVQDGVEALEAKLGTVVKQMVQTITTKGSEIKSQIAVEQAAAAAAEEGVPPAEAAATLGTLAE